MKNNIEYSKLIEIASKAKQNAYAPYSNFRVGAALLCKSGKIYTGVNVEGASFGVTNCAERTAVYKAVSEGERKFAAIAVASDSDEYIYPCGICRQVLLEFADREMKIICSNNKGEFRIYTMDELLPYGSIPI